ncbi:MAG: VWA domain-containing protein [Proteobacteria bacterium]|nr:VWA domain-containing protein [Pseudomonadota bacterium]MCP4921612.1 VWA domain-containing protein [Pseudomonadota bacterium]
MTGRRTRPLNGSSLLSDGQANVGHKWSQEPIEDARALGGIEVSAIGLGTGIDQGSLMGIADATGGEYLYLSDPAEVADAFTDQLDRLRTQSARAAEVELVLAPGVELLDVYGYEEVDGRATATGWAAEIGSVSEGDARKMVARVQVPAHVALEGEVARVEVAWSARKRHRVTLPVRVEMGEAPEASVHWWATDHVLDARTGWALDDVLEAPTAQQAEAVTAERVVLEELAYAYGRAPTTAPLERLESGWLVAAAGSEERMDLEALTALEALGYVE